MNGTGVMSGFNTSFVDPKDLTLNKMDSIHSAKKSNRRNVSLDGSTFNFANHIDLFIELCFQNGWGGRAPVQPFEVEEKKRGRWAPKLTPQQHDTRIDALLDKQFNRESHGSSSHADTDGSQYSYWLILADVSTRWNSPRDHTSEQRHVYDPSEKQEGSQASQQHEGHGLHLCGHESIEAVEIGGRGYADPVTEC